MVGSTTTTTIGVGPSSSLSQPLLLVPVAAVAIIVTSSVLLWKKKEKLKKGGKHGDITAIPGVPDVPHRHWLYGHFMYPTREGTQLEKLKAWCIDHADPITKMCRFYQFNMGIISVSSVPHAQKILRTQTQKIGLRFFDRIFQRVFGENNVAMINGKPWKVHRAPVTRALGSEGSLVAAQRHILNVGNTLIDSISNRAATNNNNNGSSSDSGRSVTMEVLPLTKMATIDVFGLAALGGADLGSCSQLVPSEVATAFEFLMDDVLMRMRHPFSPTTHWYWIPTSRNVRANKENELVKGFIRDIIHVHLDKQNKMEEGGGKVAANGDGVSDGQTTNGSSNNNNNNRGNLLSQLIGLLTENGKKELDIDELINNMMVLLFAGYDTTANGLAFALYEISQNPDVESKILEEANRVVSHMEHLLEEDKLEETKLDILTELPYCHAVFLESLRLYPPATSTLRTLERDVVLDDVGVTLPKGTVVQIPIFYMQRDESDFPNAMKFWPERWARPVVVNGGGGDGGGNRVWVQRYENDEEEKKMKEEHNADTSPTTSTTNTNEKLPPMGNRDAFLTFSSGARNCAGRRFSLQEGTLLLAMLVRKLQFEKRMGYDMEPVHEGIIMSPSLGCPMVIRPRETVEEAE